MKLRAARQQPGGQSGKPAHDGARVVWQELAQERFALGSDSHDANVDPLGRYLWILAARLPARPPHLRGDPELRSGRDLRRPRVVGRAR